MKIKDFSEEKGLSTQAIYKAISRAGFSAKQITDRKGNITGKGFSILRTLFPETESAADPVSGSGDEQQQPDDKTAEVEQLRQRVAELEAICKQWEQRYFDAVESAKQEGQQLRILLSQEQQLRLQAEKQGFFKRLFSGKKTEEQ